MAEQRPRTAAIGVIALWGAASALLLSAGVCVGGAPAEYDLTVIVLAPDVGPSQVALSYPTVMDHEAVAGGIRELAERTGAAIGEVEMRDERRGRGMEEEGTAASFLALGLLLPRAGALPVGPIVRSLPDWSRMRLVFVVGEKATYSGPVDTNADGFVVRLVNRMKPYEYDVERKTRSAPPGEARPEEERPSGALLPAALIGLPAGLIVGWLLGDVRFRSHAPRPRG
jgi:hypothetical protein